MTAALVGPWTALVAAVIGFLLGSIPFGVLVLKAMGGPDPRGIGSGNIGATNVVRAGGRGAGAATLILDAGKGVLACLLFGASVAGAVAGAFAILGHCFTPWLGFRGGKGVATFLGISILGGLAAPLVFGVAWLAMLAWTRVSAIAGVTACALSALASVAAAALAPEPARLAAAIALMVSAGIVALRHRPNFRQIRAERRARLGGSAS